MVCEKCEKKGKLGKVINPDPWRVWLECYVIVKTNCVDKLDTGPKLQVNWNSPCKLLKNVFFFSLNNSSFL